MKESVYEQMKSALQELAVAAKLTQGKLLVIGCSTSEVRGGHIGKDSSLDVAAELFKALSEVQRDYGFDVAIQCCEHLNRALLMERVAAEVRGYEEVNVVPVQHAGGSMATTAYEKWSDPVAVECVRADAGIDIGDTFIGMHLKHVVVPVRLAVKEIGAAHVTAARVRPKFVGGDRAHYNEALK